MQKSLEQRVVGATPDPSDNSLPRFEAPASARRQLEVSPASHQSMTSTEILSGSFSASQRRRLDVALGNKEIHNPDLAFSRFIKRTSPRRFPNRRAMYSSRIPARRRPSIIEKTIVAIFDRLMTWLSELLKQLEQLALGSLPKPNQIIQLMQNNAALTTPQAKRRKRFFRR